VAYVGRVSPGAGAGTGTGSAPVSDSARAFLRDAAWPVTSDAEIRGPVERALRYRRLAASIENARVSASLMEVALMYLDMAGRAQRRENAGKEIRGR
jgi:hypothetical protein